MHICGEPALPQRQRYLNYLSTFLKKVEDDFDTVNELIDDANNDMKVLLISEYNDEKGSTKLSDNGLSIELNWEVINE